MAPRHETSGAGSPDPSDTKSTPSKSYSTRSSKRKVSETSNQSPPTESPSAKKRATRSAKRSKATMTEASEDVQRPTKRLRSSGTEVELVPKIESTPTPSLSLETSQSVLDEVSDRQSVETPVSEDAPATKVVESVPKLSGDNSSDDEDILSTTPANFDDVLASQELDGERLTASPAKRGRGGWRGRRGGKLSRAAKILRAKAARDAKTKSISVTSPLPVIEPPSPRPAGRRKTTYNPHIDALSLRASELKSRYATLVKAQQKALRALNAKSLDMVKQEPTYHEQVPEFQNVSSELKEIYEDRIKKINIRENLEIDVLINAQNYNEKAIEDQFNRQVEDANDRAFARIKEHCMYVWHQFMRDADLDEIPIPLRSDGDPTKMYEVTDVPVMKEVHPFANPYWRPETAYPTNLTDGDTKYHQHPRNIWNSLDSAGKLALQKERDQMSTYVGKSQRAAQRRSDERKPIRLRSKVYKNIPKSHRVQIAEREALAALEATGPKTPKRGAKQAVPKVSLYAIEPIDWNSSADEAELADEYGVEVLSNGRLRYLPTVEFEDHEIGVRHTIWQGDRTIGTTASPNPKAFHIDQQPGGCMSGEKITSLKESDFDENIIKAHGLHPRLGLGLPTSVNPDRDRDELEDQWFPPPTDWSKPLPIPKSQRVVETFADGHRKLFHSSRNWIQEIDAQWEAFGSKLAMWQLLESSGDLKSLFPKATKKDIQRMKQLAEACKEAAEDDKRRDAEARAQAKIDYERHLTREAEAAKVAAKTVYPSSSAYDPVRDTTYQTPYPRTVPPPRPAQHAPYRRGTLLATLADLAEAPPLTLQRPPPPSHWIEPPTLTPDHPPTDLLERALAQAQARGVARLHSLLRSNYPYTSPLPPPPLPMTAPQQMGLAPNNNFLPAPSLPLQGARGNNAALRPLQPAPPRGGRRTTPPQAGPSNRGGTWYGK